MNNAKLDLLRDEIPGLKAITLLLAFTLSIATHAAHASGTAPLTAASKSRLVHLFDEALHDKTITRAQYVKSVSWVHATPCNGVDRRLTTQRRAQLEKAIAKDQKLEKVQVFESFRSDGWFILLTDASDGDEPYLFYATDPTKGGHPIATWSGGATIFETSELAQLVQTDAPGVPVRLVNCFAWHVTLGQR